MDSIYFISETERGDCTSTNQAFLQLGSLFPAIQEIGQFPDIEGSLVSFVLHRQHGVSGGVDRDWVEVMRDRIESSSWSRHQYVVLELALPPALNQRILCLRTGLPLVCLSGDYVLYWEFGDLGGGEQQ